MADEEGLRNGMARRNGMASSQFHPDEWWDQSVPGSLRHRGSVARPPWCSEGDGGKVFNQRELEYIADFAIWHDLFVFLCTSVLRKRMASWRRHAGGWESI